MNHFRFLRTAALMGWDAFREGRLSTSPRRWLIDLRHLRAVVEAEPALPVAAWAQPEPPASQNHKEVLADLYRTQLIAFLESGARLRFSPPDTPRVSVLIVLFNRAELTLRCLRSLLEDPTVSLDVVIVDNGSSDQTPRLLERLDGVHVVRSAENLGFLLACNLAAREARGEYLLFLNNDAELLPGSLSAAVRTLERDTSIGGVGGRLILPDGRLQESGSVIWNDGSCAGYGRDDSPWRPPYAYVRDIDYCSAALFLTPRRLFVDLGGFDERFKPAYYEDADYGVRLWKAGYRVVYQPRCQASHFEFASSTSTEAAIRMQIERRALFVEKHRDWLDAQHERGAAALLAARSRTTGPRVLLIDDRVPHASTGFGFPRAVELIRSLVDLGYGVTLYPTTTGTEPWDRVYAEVPETVEVMVGYGPQRLGDFLVERSGYYHAIVVSRPHNMELLRAKLRVAGCPMPPIVYDAEAVSALREIGRRRLAGDGLEKAEAGDLIAAEVGLADAANAVITVSDLERAHFVRAGFLNTHVLRHAIVPVPTARSWEDRYRILFVGAFHELSPNAESVLWFVGDVLPRLRRMLALDVRLTVVGQNPPPEVVRLAGQSLEVFAGVADLVPFYESARLFVAPTRFAAGIPLKVCHAAAHGVPVVATSLLADQLGWRRDHDLLAADHAEEFAHACASIYSDASRWQALRNGALARVASDYAPDRFTMDLGTVFTSIGLEPRAQIGASAELCSALTGDPHLD